MAKIRDGTNTSVLIGRLNVPGAVNDVSLGDKTRLADTLFLSVLSLETFTVNQFHNIIMLICNYTVSVCYQ